MPRPSPALVVATFALFVALGGTGYAVTKLPANSVGTTQLRKDAVVSAKVKDGSLGTADLSAAARAALRGAAGAPGPAGPRGATGPSAGASTTATPLQTLDYADVAVVTSEVMEVADPSLLVVDSDIQMYKGTGFSTAVADGTCHLEYTDADVIGWAQVGASMRATALPSPEGDTPGSGFTVYVSVSPTGGVAVPAGRYQVRAMCKRTADALLAGPTATMTVKYASITAIATGIAP